LVESRNHSTLAALSIRYGKYLKEQLIHCGNQKILPRTTFE